jgi:hypothetical protein
MMRLRPASVIATLSLLAWTRAADVGQLLLLFW